MKSEAASVRLIASLVVVQGVAGTEWGHGWH